jgi:hypothetical protein
MEGSEFFISSFFYLILVLFIWDRLRKFNFSVWLVPVIMTLVIFIFRFGEDISIQSSFVQFEKAFQSNVVVQRQSQKVKRVIGSNDFANQNYADFKTFLDSNFDKSATFIDFSNTPMLYFYTGRKVPSYFNQYMQNGLTKYIQQENLKQISSMNIPVVLFSNAPEGWWDATDGVNNTIRYGLIADFIYRNYKPYGIFDKHDIWIKNSLKLPTPKATDSSLVFSPKHYDLRYYPYLLAKSSDSSPKRTLFSDWKNVSECYLEPSPLYNRFENFVEITLAKQLSSKKLTLSFAKDSIQLGTFSFRTVVSDQEVSYIIPVSAQYNWISFDCNKLAIFTKEGERVLAKRIQLLKIPMNEN